MRGEYLTFLGGTETFGQFIETPYPDIIEGQTGLPAINLGCRHPGIDTFNTSPGLIDICSMAQVTVIQIMGAANMSNRFYTVDPRHNERFIRASKRFKEIYPEVDFSTFETTDQLLCTLAEVGPDRLGLVRQEVQSAWVARMRTLLGQIDGKKVLLWMSDHRPYCADTGGTICRDPLFIDRAMLNAVKDYADALIEIVGTQGEILAGRSDMVFSEIETFEAQKMLGPMVHERTAIAIQSTLAALKTGPASKASTNGATMVS